MQRSLSPAPSLSEGLGLEGSLPPESITSTTFTPYFPGIDASDKVFPSRKDPFFISRVSRTISPDKASSLKLREDTLDNISSAAEISLSVAHKTTISSGKSLVEASMS